MKLLKILIIANLLAVAGTTVVKAQVYTPTPLGAYQFRVIVSNSVGSVTSDAATFSFSSSIPAMPLWALTALVALIFLMAMPSLTKRHCAT